MQNFGKIKNTFNSLLVEGIANKTNENKAIFSKFVRALRESRLLRTQFNIYYDIEKKAETNEFKSTEFVKESISLMGKFSKGDIETANKKLVSILEKHNLKISDEPYNNSNLHENISNLIFTKKNSSNINSLVESLSMVVGYVKENISEVKQSNSSLPNSLISNLMVDKFNDKYSDLNENEKKLIKSLIQSNEEEKKGIYKNLTSECLELINNNISESVDVTVKEVLLNVKEALLKMEFTNESYIEDIGKLIKLKNDLNE